MTGWAVEWRSEEEKTVYAMKSRLELAGWSNEYSSWARELADEIERVSTTTRTETQGVPP